MTGPTRREGTEFAPAGTVLDFLNARKCRVLYRMRRQKGLQGHGDRAADRAKGSSLCILDYERGAPYPTLIEYPDEPRFKCFGPLFSPDGTKVVYNQTFGASDISVLRIGAAEPVKAGHGANPHWYVDRKTGRTHVVYRDDNGKFEGVPQPGKTYALAIDDEGRPVGTPELLADHGFGGGISSDGRYLCTAFLLACALDRQTGRVSAPWGTVLREPGHTNQCCCPSTAPDDSGRFMVLRWPHERFSITDFTGASHVHFPLPDGREEWQTPEWSTHPDFCTAAAMTSESIYDVYIVRIPDKQYLQITPDGGYVHGHLWVGEHGS